MDQLKKFGFSSDSTTLFTSADHETEDLPGNMPLLLERYSDAKTIKLGGVTGLPTSEAKD